MEEELDQWLWDRRTNKAYRPVEADDGTVTLVSVWHRDEVADALEKGALEPLDEVSGENIGFNHFDSFRLLDDEELERFGGDDE